MEPSVTGEPAVEILAALDALSRRFIGSIDTLRFDTAHDKSDREAVYRLRYETVINRGWAQPGDMPDGMEHDQYDERAIHIVVWDGHELVATSRLVLPGGDLALPTEEAFHIRIEPHGQVVDMGRQIVAPEYGSIKHRVFAALLAKTWLEIRANDYSLVCGDFSPAMTRLYRMMGFDVKVLGQAQSFWGEDRTPIMVDVAKSMQALMERWGSQKPAD